MSTEYSDDVNSRIITKSGTDDFFLSKIEYRKASPTDILKCVEMLQKNPIPTMLFSSKNDFQYRQHYAAPYFRCAVYQDEKQKYGEDNIIGFITGIRFEMAENDHKTLGSVLTNTYPHDPNGNILAIRSCVIGGEYRNKGLGKAMIKDYVEKMRQITKESSKKSSQIKPIDKIVGLGWGQVLLTFYINSGFSVKKADEFTEAFALTDQQKQKQLQPPFYFELPLAHSIDCGAVATINEYNCYIVDSFATKPGTGNPAAVVLLPEDFNHEMKHKWMQKVAAEFNLAETAFCWPKGSNESNVEEDATAMINGESHWNIRFFTPTVEMGLCGHATLASAAVLYQALTFAVLPPGTAVVFHADEDILTMNLDNDGQKDTVPSQRISKVSMAFPAKPTTELSTREEKAAVRNMLKSAFSIELKPLYVGLSDIGDLLVELSPEVFCDIGYSSLNFKAFLEWDGYYRGIVICCLAPESKSEDIDGLKVDFLSRFFAPKAGINEDPVTGSAHCSLGPYFARKLLKSKVVGRQMSMRSGIVKCDVSPDVVTLTGTAITIMTGKLFM
jgi:PhzF family phenazine biosynthesis protein